MIIALIKFDPTFVHFDKLYGLSMLLNTHVNWDKKEPPQIKGWISKLITFSHRAMQTDKVIEPYHAFVASIENASAAKAIFLLVNGKGHACLMFLILVKDARFDSSRSSTDLKASVWEIIIWRKQALACTKVLGKEIWHGSKLYHWLGHPSLPEMLPCKPASCEFLISQEAQHFCHYKLVFEFES